MSNLANTMSLLNSIAMGDAHSELVIYDSSLVNVYTGEILPHTDVAIAKGRIAYVGTDAKHTIGPRTHKVNAKGRYIAPGFADAHIHIDQFVTPHEFTAQSVLHGVTTLFSDPIDVTSSCGNRGFIEFLRMCQNAYARIYNVIPGGLPVNKKYSTARGLGSKQEIAALKRSDVLGLGEVFSWTRVTNRDSQTMKKLQSMIKGNHIINGHTAGAKDKKLQAYIASGIFSCHEPIDYAQTIERLRLGMWVMIREGSIRRSLEPIVTEILDQDIDTSRLMFCTDGVNPPDMLRYGQIDHCVRQAIKLGMNPVTAYTIASRNTFDYYSQSNNVGGIAPGKLADIIILDDLENVHIRDVYVGGMHIVHKSKLVNPIKRSKIPAWSSKVTKVGCIFTRNDFTIKSDVDCIVNTIIMKSEIITGKSNANLITVNGNLETDSNEEMIRAAAFDRLGGTHKGTVAFMEGMGNFKGAIATTWSFHENDLIVIGASQDDMAMAANIAARKGGGIAMVQNKKCTIEIPLEFGGILSRANFANVAKSLEKLDSTMQRSGCRFAHGHLIPLFLPFLALPSIRLIHNGLIDIKSEKMIPVIALG